MSTEIKYLNSKDTMLGVLVATAWGMNGVFTGIAVEVGPPIVMLLVRTSISALLLFFFYPKPPKKIKLVLLITAILVLGHLLNMFISFRMGLPSSIGVLVLQTSTLFLSILGIVLFKEKIHPLGLLGIILAFIGVVILLGAPNVKGVELAFLIMVVSGMFWAIYSIIVKQYTKDINPMQLLTWVSIFGIPMVVILTFIFVDYNSTWIDFDKMTLKHSISMVYIGFAPSILGHGVWCYLLTRHSLSQIAPFILLAPIFGILGGVFLRDELFSFNMIIGGSIIILGLVLNRIKKKNKTINQRR